MAVDIYKNRREVMATCLLCNKNITTGYVLCGECAAGVKLNTESEVLGHFVEWLGAELANDLLVNPCSMCGRAHCDDISQCRSGVTAWLRTKAEEYCKRSPGCGSHGEADISGPGPASTSDNSLGGSDHGTACP